MQLAISGASGLIGRALRARLESDGHQVLALVRPSRDRAPGPGEVTWDPPGGTIDATALEGVDAVVHLAGAGVASGRWTDEHRRAVHDSRTQGTTLLAEALAGLDRPPDVFVSASAIGYYGDRGDEVLTEAAAPGEDFLARVCVDWERSAVAAESAGIRTVRVRTGIVLSADGGALKAQLLPFRLGLGGRAGRGDQWMSWIAIDDEVRAIQFAIEHPDVAGPVNLTAPAPVTNAAFTKALGQVLHRPTVMVIPRAVTRLPLGIGTLAQSLLFSSARVEPRALLEHGFEFRHTELTDALGQVLDRR
ncbi:MAG: hypothetical protein JWM05_2261 [Acidimicrobiales bacterium]|nr:hypothetical protein [Acidimicrobiales bacterium]